jgi:hypothetical protein
MWTASCSARCTAEPLHAEGSTFLYTVCIIGRSVAMTLQPWLSYMHVGSTCRLVCKLAPLPDHDPIMVERRRGDNVLSILYVSILLRPSFTFCRYIIASKKRWETGPAPECLWTQLRTHVLGIVRRPSTPKRIILLFELFRLLLVLACVYTYTYVFPCLLKYSGRTFVFTETFWNDERNYNSDVFQRWFIYIQNCCFSGLLHS